MDFRNESVWKFFIFRFAGNFCFHHHGTRRATTSDFAADDVMNSAAQQQHRVEWNWLWRNVLLQFSRLGSTSAPLDSDSQLFAAQFIIIPFAQERAPSSFDRFWLALTARAVVEVLRAAKILREDVWAYLGQFTTCLREVYVMWIWDVLVAKLQYLFISSKDCHSVVW